MTEFETNPCKDLAPQFLGIMLSLAQESPEVRNALGVTMNKGKEQIQTNVSLKAANSFSDPMSGNSLSFILDEMVTHKCGSTLGLTIIKLQAQGYIINQKLKPRE